MKRLISVFSLVTLFMLVLGYRQLATAKADGAPSGNTGSPGDGQTCAHVSCHTGSAVPKINLISTDVPLTGYLSGNTYTVTVTISETGILRFGFQASPQNIAGDLLGAISVINTVETKTTGGGKYITHTLSGNSGVDTKTWTFHWTPEDATGDVTFYVAVNAANNDDHASGDHIYTSSVTIPEDPSNIPLTVETLNKIRFDINNPVTDILYITMQTAVNSAVNMTLCDGAGRVVFECIEDHSNGNFEIPMTGLASGWYFITLNNGSDQITKKIIKL